MFGDKFDKFKVPAALAAATMVGIGIGRISLPSAESLSFDDIEKYKSGLFGRDISVPGVRLTKIDGYTITLSDAVGNPYQWKGNKMVQPANNEMTIWFSDEDRGEINKMIAYESQIANRIGPDSENIPFAFADIHINENGGVELKGFRFREFLKE